MFFKLLDIVADTFDLNNPPVEDLINKDGLVVKLKAGKQLPIKGVYKDAGRHLKIEFSYNRTFSIADSYPSGGSWTCQMRPDYTLSLWPAEFSQDEAEMQELISHVHFDAKYKVDSLVKLFGESEVDLDNEKADQRNGNYKRADLLKMHAYRDAIRRSAGAYVLYPGTDQSNFTGFHESVAGASYLLLHGNDEYQGDAQLFRSSPRDQESSPKKH